MGKSQRTKGHSWERGFARLLREKVFTDCPEDVHRGQQAHNPNDPDVSAPCWRFECKVGKAPSVWAALQQLKEDGDKANDTFNFRAVAIKKDRTEPFVAIPLDDFLELLQNWWRESAYNAIAPNAIIAPRDFG